MGIFIAFIHLSARSIVNWVKTLNFIFLYVFVPNEQEWVPFLGGAFKILFLWQKVYPHYVA